MNESTSNVDSEIWIVILFFIISSILLCGTLLQIFLLLPLGDKFYNIVVKKIKWLYILITFIKNLSIIYFPVATFYIFIRLYLNKAITLF